jgi:hypothetical protein
MACFRVRGSATLSHIPEEPNPFMCNLFTFLFIEFEECGISRKSCFKSNLNPIRTYIFLIGRCVCLVLYASCMFLRAVCLVHLSDFDQN